MAIQILKNTPIHAVIAITGAAASETINLSTTLAITGQTAATPLVDIKHIHWSVPVGVATIVRNSVTLWNVTGAYNLDFCGFTDNREHGSNIVITLPAGGGTVIVELMKISGYGDSQHINPLT